MKKQLKRYLLVLSSIFIFSINVIGCSDHKPNSPANATEATKPTEESTSVTDETSTLPEGTAYIMEDGKQVYIEDLMTPIITYNNICTSGNADKLPSVYPDGVIKFLLDSTNFSTQSEYATYLYELYCKVYNEKFSMNNEYISCIPLSATDIENFHELYLNNFNEDITPEYAFIVESSYTINYTDEKGNEKSDTDTDFFIAYFFNNTFYLGYFYIDTLDL